MTEADGQSAVRPARVWQSRRPLTNPITEQTRANGRVPIVVVGAVYEPYVPALQAAVSHPVSFRVAPTASDEDVCPLLSDAGVVVTSTWTLAMRAAAPNLRFLQIPGAGWDKVLGDAIPSGVLVANCYEHESGIAEYVMMSCLALTRQLISADRALRRNRWDFRFDAGHGLYSELGHKVMGLVGLGRIGRAVARLATAFRMSTIAIDVEQPTPEELAEIPVAWVGKPNELNTLLRHADYVVIAVPLTDLTRELIGDAELSLMKPSAVLINVARAEIVVEQALYEALRRRSIAGAGLDPWWFYPESNERVAPSRYPFHRLDNVVMTPHYSGSTVETVEARMRVVATNIDRYLTGRAVQNVVRELSRV